MAKLVIISVVRDWTMYTKCVGADPNLVGAVLTPIDNREKNESISVCYNRFLNSYDYSIPAWFVFCHEDFQVFESYVPYLDKADTNSLYGPIGVVTRRHFGAYFQWLLQGTIEGCDRRGGHLIHIGHSVPMGAPVETFDCQCLIVHSSLIQRTGIRFDEHLTFDLYVEDFCMQAKEGFGVLSRILPIRCRHWSDSTAKPRYFVQADYMRAKWPSVCYTGTSSHMIGGGAGLLRRFDHAWKSVAQVLLRHIPWKGGR